MSALKMQKCAIIVEVFSEGNFVASIDVPLATKEDAIQCAREFVQLHYPYLDTKTLNFSVKEASKLNLKKKALDGSTPAIGYRFELDDSILTTGLKIFDLKTKPYIELAQSIDDALLWQDTWYGDNGVVFEVIIPSDIKTETTSLNTETDEGNIITLDTYNVYGNIPPENIKKLFSSVWSSEQQKFQREASKLNMMKKAWSNPPRDEDHYPGSNVSGPVPYSVPKSPGSKPRREQRTKDDYHAPSQLDRDPIPGEAQPEQGTGGQSHSGEPRKPDSIYPEPMNWLRPLKGLPFTDEHLLHDFNEDFDTEYYIRQRGLNMRRRKFALNMKKAQHQFERHRLHTAKHGQIEINQQILPGAVEEIYELEYKMSQTKFPQYREFYRKELEEILDAVIPVAVEIFKSWLDFHEELVDDPDMFSLHDLSDEELDRYRQQYSGMADNEISEFLYNQAVEKLTPMIATVHNVLNMVQNANTVAEKSAAFSTALQTVHTGGIFAEHLIEFRTANPEDYKQALNEFLDSLSRGDYIPKWNVELRKEGYKIKRYVFERGLNMRRHKFALNMKKAQEEIDDERQPIDEPSKWPFGLSPEEWDEAKSLEIDSIVQNPELISTVFTQNERLRTISQPQALNAQDIMKMYELEYKLSQLPKYTQSQQQEKFVRIELENLVDNLIDQLISAEEILDPEWDPGFRVHNALLNARDARDLHIKLRAIYSALQTIHETGTLADYLIGPMGDAFLYYLSNSPQLVEKWDKELLYKEANSKLNMKKAQQISKYTDPEYLGNELYNFVKKALQTYQDQIQEHPGLGEHLVNESIPHFIAQNQQLLVNAGVTLPIMLEAIKDAAKLLMSNDKIGIDTLPSKQKAIELYPDPREKSYQMPQMTMDESRLLDELTPDEIWSIARNPEIENTPEGQAARGLIQKGIVASRLNMKKKAIDIEAEANRIAALWKETANAVGAEEILSLFADRTNIYNTVMADIKGIYSKEDAHAIALRVIDLVPQIIQTGSKLNMKKIAAVNPKYDYGVVQTSDVPETVTDVIKNIQGSINKDKLYDGEDEPGWVENGIQKLFHITVLFGVNDDVKDEAKKVFDKYRPVHIETTGIKYFSSDPNYDVAIVRCKSEELTKIHDELKDTLENEETYPNYKPHITIAYLKKGERLDDNEQITSISWEVDSLDLSTSDGKLEKISALAIPIRESLDYPYSWRKRKKKKKDKEIVTEKEKKILQMDSNKLNLKKKAQDYEYMYNWLIRKFPEEYKEDFVEAFPKNAEGYDFGGAENPFHPGLTIVDTYISEEPSLPGGENLIEGDLTTPLNLEPKSFINMSSTLSPLSFAEDLDAMFSQVVDNIDRALLPGGKVRLFDAAYLVRPVFDLLKNLGYVKVWDSVKEPEDEERALDLDEEDEGEDIDIILQKPQVKRASILDEPRAELDPAIWSIGEDDLPFLKPDVKIHIVKNFFDYISQFGGYVRPEEFVKNMFYTGSTATRRFKPESDVDIHIIVDWIDLAALNPDKTKKDPKEMHEDLHNIFWWTLNKQKLPGTKHPLTYYVVKPGEEKKILEAKEEIYSIGHDCWLVPPGDVIDLPREAITIATEEASDIMSRIEEHLANARKNIMDYDMLKILEKLNDGNTPIILQKFDETLKVIDEELVALKDEYALLKQKRQEGFELGKPIVPSESKNYTLGNIIFKLVERYKLMDILREIKHITDAKPLEHGQVDDVADALGFENE